MGEVNDSMGYDLYAAITNKEITEGKYIPTSDVLPKEVVWANEEQKKYCEDLIDGIAEAITSAFEFVFEGLAEKIWTAMLQWFYVTIFDAVADFFTYINSMGADVFSLSWVEATVKLFTLFGWALFVAGIVVAVFELAIEYQSGGRANIKTTALNFLKGFFAATNDFAFRKILFCKSSA